MTLRIRRLEQSIIKAITSRMALSLYLLLSLIFALIFAVTFGATLSGKTSVVDGTVEVDIGQTRLPLCAFSAPLNAIEWGQIVGNLTALTNQQQGVVIETAETQDNQLRIVLNLSGSGATISLCPLMPLNQSYSGGLADYFASMAQKVYIKIARVLHVYASPPSDQSVLTEIAILGIDDNGDKVSLYLTFSIMPRLALGGMTLTLLTYGVTASLLYLALALDRRTEPYHNRTPSRVEMLIMNRGLLLIPAYIVLTVLHAGMALSLAFSDAVFYTSMVLVAIVVSFGILFAFFISHAASAVALLSRGKTGLAERTVGFVVNVFYLFAFLGMIYSYIVIIPAFLPHLFQLLHQLSLHQLWLYVLNNYLLYPMKVILPVIAPLLAAGLEALTRRRGGERVVVRPEIVLVLFYIVATIDLFIPIIRSSFLAVGYTWFVVGGGLMILLLFVLCTGALLVTPPCSVAHSRSGLRCLSLLIAVPALILVVIMMVVAVRVNVAGTEAIRAIMTLATIVYFYLYPYWFAATLCREQSTHYRSKAVISQQAH